MSPDCGGSSLNCFNSSRLHGDQAHAALAILITRRCTQRQFLLRPSATVNGIIGYCLAVAAERYGLRLRAFCAMSNHLHIVATDVRGEAPEFCRWLFEFTAKCLNAHWGRWSE